MKTIKQPSIYYEENHDGLTNGFPFMQIDRGQSSPGVLFIASVFDSEDLVEGSDTETIKDVVVQSYYNSDFLKENLDEETYQKVRNTIFDKKGM